MRKPSKLQPASNKHNQQGCQRNSERLGFNFVRGQSLKTWVWVQAECDTASNFGNRNLNYSSKLGLVCGFWAGVRASALYHPDLW
eukprot:12077691-Karenia_brevis.AAC.1